MSVDHITEGNETAAADESGQTMTEYGVVLSLIAIVTVVTFEFLGDHVEAAVNRVIGLFS